MNQQTRWKRSWTRESLIVAKFIWRKHPVASFFTYMSIVLPLIAPVAALHAMLWGPLMHGGTLPLIYFAGHLRAGARLLALLRAASRTTTTCCGCTGSCSCFFYLAIMLWQTYYAIVTCRTATWGTRPATAGLGGESGGS